VEEHQPELRLPEQLGQSLLRIVQGPARGHQPAILVAVGIAQHDHLATTAQFQQIAPLAALEQAPHHVFGRFQIGHGLEQGHQIETTILDAGGACNQPGREHVVGIPAHAHDQGLHRASAKPTARLGGRLDQPVHRMFWLSFGSRRGQRLDQALAVPGRRKLGPIRIGKQLRHRLMQVA